jgi:hypothetical protein
MKKVDDPDGSFLSGEIQQRLTDKAFEIMEEALGYFELGMLQTDDVRNIFPGPFGSLLLQTIPREEWVNEVARMMDRMLHLAGPIEGVPTEKESQLLKLNPFL